MNATTKLALKLVLAVVLVAVLLSYLSLGAAFTKLRALDATAVAASFAMVLLAVLTAAVKFRLALADFYMWPVLRTTILLQFYNLYLPGQAGGELLRIFMLGGRREGADRLFAATILDRLTGLFSLCILMLWAFAVVPWHLGLPLTIALAVLCAGTLVGTLLLVFLKPQWIEAAMLRLPMPERLRQTAHTCLLAVQGFARRPKYLLRSLTLGLIHQGLIIGSFMSLGEGLGIHVTSAMWTIVVGVNSLVMLLPITFAGIGTRDISLVTVLGLAGVLPEAALALSLGVLALQTVFSAACGLLLFTPRPDAFRRVPASGLAPAAESTPC